MTENARSACEVCADLGIEIIPTKVRRQTDGAPQTTAVATIDKMIHEHGEGHTIFVLRTIAETEGNADELVSYTIEAVSRLVRYHPQWTDRGLEWFEAFDRIDLKAIRDLCRQNIKIVPMAVGINTIVFNLLFDLLGDPASSAKHKRNATDAATTALRRPPEIPGSMRSSASVNLPASAELSQFDGCRA